ncbi:MAG TPA: 23S rRNA (guanosine(2251)-2'-O)-methyltransferase RlmB [Prolixibacteraceae bacterium]|nr:23S rRNA (guanosine(2251)-2'-O)-methyltransferase RlmB [Prolixibacteraceae bacterium]
MYNKQDKPADDLIFGIRAVIEAIQAGKEIDKVLIKKGLIGDLFKEMFDLIRIHQVPFQYVPIEKINRISRKNHQGVLAFVSPVALQRIEDIIPTLYEDGITPMVMLLDQVTDVRNFGAIVRSAECAGVHAIVIPDKGSARINADAVKTSAGALHLVPVCRTRSMKETVSFLKESGLKMVAATEKATEIYTNANLSGPMAIIMGSEDTGIDPRLLALADQQVKIPILGKIESLNVSVAAGLLIYEVVRQRGLTEDNQ